MHSLPAGTQKVILMPCAVSLKVLLSALWDLARLRGQGGEEEEVLRLVAGIVVLVHIGLRIDGWIFIEVRHGNG
jgi:hypothetical protein